MEDFKNKSNLNLHFPHKRDKDGYLSIDYKKGKLNYNDCKLVYIINFPLGFYLIDANTGEIIIKRFEIRRINPF